MRTHNPAVARQSSSDTAAAELSRRRLVRLIRGAIGLRGRGAAAGGRRGGGSSGTDDNLRLSEGVIPSRRPQYPLAAAKTGIPAAGTSPSSLRRTTYHAARPSPVGNI